MCVMEQGGILKLVEGVGRGYQNEEILRYLSSGLLQSLTSDSNQGHKVIFTVNIL